MFNQPLPGMAGLLLGLTMMMTVPAAADALKTRSRRPASCGWRLRSVRPVARSGRPRPKPVMPACRSISARRWPSNLAFPSNMSRTTIPARSSMRRRRAPGTSPSCRKIRSVRAGCRSDRSMRLPTRPTSSSRVRRYEFRNARSTRHQGRCRQQHDHDARRDRASEECQGHGLPDLRRDLRPAQSGEIDAFALSRDQLNAMAKQIPGTRVLDETFKQTVTAVRCRPIIRSRWRLREFLTEAIANGTLRKAYDNNGLKDGRCGRRRSKRELSLPSFGAQVRTLMAMQASRPRSIVRQR